MTAVTVMTPVVRVPVLSSTTILIRRAGSSARALLTRMPSSAPRPTAATSAVGRGQAERARAGDHQDGDGGAPGRGGGQARRPARSRGSRTARAITHGTKTAAIRSASRCALALVRLGLGDQPGDLGEQRVGADPGGADDEPAAHVHGGPGHLVARPDLHGHGLAGDERRVDRRAALGHDAVGGDLLARADHEQLARGQFADRHPVLGPVAQHGDALGAERGQRGQRGRRPVPGPGLQVAAGEHGGGDARGGLEVEGHARWPR